MAHLYTEWRMLTWAWCQTAAYCSRLALSFFLSFSVCLSVSLSVWHSDDVTWRHTTVTSIASLEWRRTLTLRSRKWRTGACAVNIRRKSRAYSVQLWRDVDAASVAIVVVAAAAAAAAVGLVGLVVCSSWCCYTHYDSPIPSLAARSTSDMSLTDNLYSP